MSTAHSVVYADPSGRFRANRVHDMNRLFLKKDIFYLEWGVAKGYMAKKEVHGINLFLFPEAVQQLYKVNKEQNI